MKTMMVSALTAALTVACFLVLQDSFASRNSSGSMQNINGPYITGTLISDSIVNARLADIENELTDSLSRGVGGVGKGPMLAPLQLAPGTFSAPGLSFATEPGSGLYRISAGDIGFAILGAKVGEWTANGLRVANGAVATPSLSFFSDTSTGFYRGSAGILRTAITGVDALAFGQASGAYYGIWFSGAIATPTVTNASLSGNGTNTAVNAPTGGTVQLNVNNVTIASVASTGFTVGAGTALLTLSAGTCALNVASPSQCTSTVPTGSHCVCSIEVTSGSTGCEASVTATTLTVSTANGVAGNASWICRS